MSSLGESSLGLSLGSEASSSSPAKSVASDSSQRTAHYSGRELSLSTQRRLIRKPLPHVPSLGARAEAAQQDDTALPRSPSYPAVPAEPPGLLAEQWWPPFDALPEMARQGSQTPFPPHPEIDLLDDVSQAHLHALLRCALQTNDIPLPACYHTAIYDAVLAALGTLAEDKTLSGLQRTACILWRAEAQMKMLNPSSPEPTASSRWARLGWPAAAFRGMVHMQSGPSTSGPAQALEASLAESQPHRLSKEQKVRKRDVALAILSNAVWLVGTRRSGVAHRSGAGRADRKAGRDAKHQQRATQIEKREPPFKRGALPNFIAPSAPTTAISTNPSPSLSTVNSSSTSIASQRSPSPASESHSTPTAGSREPSPAHALPMKDTRVLTPSSRAMEQLASLNAAAGAALQAQARLNSRERHGEPETAPPNCPSRSSSMSSRPQTDAEALETAALEKAEKEFIARVGEDCEERAKMVIATVMVDLRLSGVSPPRRRSGQGSDPESTSGQDADLIAENDRANGSAISTKTHRTTSTVTEVKNGAADPTPETSDEQPVCWVPGTFRGSKLFTDPFKDQSEKTRKDSERIKRAGGTFVVQAQTKEEGELITETLAVALFTAASMLLESAMLKDVGYARPQLPRSRSQNQSTSEDAAKESDANATSGRTEKSEQPTGEEPDTSKFSKQGRRWTKSFWGMLQSSSDAVSAALSGAIKVEHGDVPRSRTLSLARTSTEDGSMRSRMSAAVALSYSRETGGSSARKHTRFGRLFKDAGDVNGHGERNGSLTEEEGHGGDEPQSSRDGLPAPAPPLGHKVSHSLPALSMATEALLRPPPFSTSPEISAGLRQTGQLANSESLRGPQYLRAFTTMQTLAVLVGGQGSPTSASLATPKPNAGYFGSLSSATSAVRSFSIASTLSQIEDTVGTDPPPPTPGTPLLTPGGLGRSGQIHASRMKREEVVCYQQAGAGRDIHLGHVIEDMCSRAETLDLERQMKAAATLAASGKPGRSSTESLPLTVSYLHDGHRITIATQTLPKPQSDLTQEAAAATLKAFGGANGEDDEDEGDTDIAAVATTLHADRDAARTAVALAEEAIHAAENEGGPKSSNVVWLWSANARNGQQTQPKPISEATWLMSFAKFLETLIYHPGMISMEGEDPAGRYDIVRLFKKEGTLVKVSLQPLTVYPLEVEGPTVRRQPVPEARQHAEERGDSRQGDAIEETRLEIQRFYGSAKEHIADLQRICVERSLDENGMTIKSPGTSSDKAPDLADLGEDSDLASILTSETDQSPVALLNKLKSAFRADEFGLYDALKEISPYRVNDVRKSFKDCCRSAQQRLAAWTKKHLTKAELSQLAEPQLKKPAYMEAGQHPFPGSCHVVREDEPLSIIAFSLSSNDFQSELKAYQRTHLSVPETDKLADVLHWRSEVMPAKNSQLSASFSSVTSSINAAGRDRGSVWTAEADPDSDGWFIEPQPVNVALKRKKRGREGSILSLTLKRVGSSISSSSDHHASTGRESASTEGESLNSEDVDDLFVSGLDPHAVSGRSKPMEPKKYFKSSTISSAGTNSTFRAHITQVTGRAPSLASVFSKDAIPGAVFGDDESLTASQTSESRAALAADNVDDEAVPSTENHGWARRGSNLPPPPGGESRRPSVARSVAETPAGSVDRAPSMSRPLNAPVQAESPHIKHTLYHGNIKVSCLSWFAEEFATLRKRWGVEEDFAQSLSSSTPWHATGGKSRSTFFKTRDEKWIGKQLLTVWSVDEKDALLEFAPAYIRYMLNADVNECPSLLVKIAGFYTLKVKDTKSGETRMKMSVMILENLFAGIGTKAVRFDLKGIRDRRAPRTPMPPGSTIDEALPPVYWDAEWLEHYQNKAFVPEEDKALFTQALQNDLSFLTESNVMDFSLLVGLTEPEHGAAPHEGDGHPSTYASIRVRIVDYISSFTLAKQLESSSKKALKSSEARGNVTVLPPSEYAARFESAMISYFTGVPGRKMPGQVSASANASARKTQEGGSPKTKRLNVPSVF